MMNDREHLHDNTRDAGYFCTCGADYASLADLGDHLRYYTGTSSFTTEVPMEPTFREYFQGIFDDALELLIDRQRKYGPENIRSQGFYGVFTRLRNDKINRLARSLSGQIKEGVLTIEFDERVTDESIEDTLLDIMNYAAILLSLYRGDWCPPMGDADA